MSPGTRTSFDGVYEGTRTPREAGPDCGIESPVGYEVSGGHIWLRTHKQRRSLDGTVSPDGRFLMANESGDHQISGSITGDHLVGTETMPLPHHKHSRMEWHPDDVCRAQIEARRDPQVPQ